MPQSKSCPDLLIAGASARAAAFSAFRAGLKTAAADQFADQDLSLVADATVIGDWPQGLLRWTDSFPFHVPLMYVGGSENEPGLLDRIQDPRPIIGVVGETLRSVRCPESLEYALSQAGIRFASLLRAEGGSTGGRSLVKPRKSGGGRGIRFWDGKPLAAGEYLQRFQEGISCSASYLVQGGHCELIGVTEAIMPIEDSRDRFRYTGSVTADFDAEYTETLNAVGAGIARMGVQGLFGVDFIRSDSEGGPLTVLEVNPRYTASMEILELRSGRSVVAEHLRAFGRCDRRDKSQSQTERSLHYGKKIVYASQTVRVHSIPLPSISEISRGDYSFADVPPAGSVHQAGAPLCTVLASGPTPEMCRSALAQLELEALSFCDVL